MTEDKYLSYHWSLWVIRCGSIRPYRSSEWEVPIQGYFVTDSEV